MEVYQSQLTTDEESHSANQKTHNTKKHRKHEKCMKKGEDDDVGDEGGDCDDNIQVGVEQHNSHQTHEHHETHKHHDQHRKHHHRHHDHNFEGVSTDHTYGNFNMLYSCNPFNSLTFGRNRSCSS